MDPMELEGVAQETLEKHGFETPPVDGFELAHELKIGIEWVDGSDAWRFRRRIYIPRETYRQRLHANITHEIAHVRLDDYRIRQSEPAACYLGAALLVPRKALDRDLRRGWDLHALMGRHVNASAELLARRIVDVRHASLAVYEHGRCRSRVGHHGMGAELERELADEALATERPIRVDGLTGAWPVIGGGYRRVLVLAA
jgi:hypothetical protein